MAFHCRCEHLESECNYPACFNGDKDRKAEVRAEAQEPVTVGTIAHYSGGSSLIKALTRITQQPPAPCPKCAENASFRLLAVEHANVTTNEALRYQKSIRDLQTKVAEQSEEIAQLIKVRDEYLYAAAGHLNVRAQQAELITELDKTIAKQCAERDALQANVSEQSAEIERLTKINSGVVGRSNTNVVQNARLEEAITKQVTRIAELEQAVAFNGQTAQHYLAGRTDALQQVYEQAAEIARLTKDRDTEISKRFDSEQSRNDWKELCERRTNELSTAELTITQQTARITELAEERQEFLATIDKIGAAVDYDFGGGLAELVVSRLTAQDKRINWLETAFDKSWNGVIDSGGATYWRIAGDHRRRFQNMNGATFREAIDAAIAKGTQ